MIKRVFDIFFSAIFLIVFSPVLFFSWIIACIDTKSNGIFLQKRIGQFGKQFLILKLRTIHPKSNKISKIGIFLRRFKLDELPQLINVLLGAMSVVGPRPDVPGYYDKLKGAEKHILKLKPGITSEAAIKYSNEESLLQHQQDAAIFNDTVLFPDKVKLNLDYYKHQSILLDIKIILKTILSFFKKKQEFQ